MDLVHLMIVGPNITYKSLIDSLLVLCLEKTTKQNVGQCVMGLITNFCAKRTTYFSASLSIMKELNNQRLALLCLVNINVLNKSTDYSICCRICL